MGAGNDTLIGNGGADILLGRHGDDVLTISDDDFAFIDGGLGNDTLRLDSSTMTLNLITLPNNRLESIEIIDLNGMASTLMLATDDILSIGRGAENTLQIDGDSTNTLGILSKAIFTDSGVTQNIDDTNYRVYQATDSLGLDDSVSLLVAPDVSVEIAIPAIELSAIQKSTNNNGFVINFQSQPLFSTSTSVFSVSGAGDVNGDGLDDILVRSNRSYVVFGKSDGGEVELRGDRIRDDAGFVLGYIRTNSDSPAISGVGDINGDGLDDILISIGGRFSGASYVVFGKAGFGKNHCSVVELNITGGNADEGFVINGGFVWDWLRGDDSRYSASGAGDINGDGLDDIIIGVPYADRNGDKSKSGASYVVFGKTDGGAVELSEIAGDGNDAGFVLNGGYAGDRSGNSVSGVGDVNGDGLDDIIIGAFFADSNGGKSGASYVVFGKSDGGVVELSEIASDGNDAGFVINGVNSGDFSGRSVSGAGDVNGDGLDDLIIGAPGADTNRFHGNGVGVSYVVFGKTDGNAVELSDIADNAGFVLNGAGRFDSSGYSVSGAGDINGDGLDDLIIGAYYADPNGNDSGASYVVFGKSDGNAVELSLVEFGFGGFVINGASQDDYSGRLVSGAGDVNGDGFDDLLVGAPHANLNGDPIGGSSYVIFGGQGVLSTDAQTLPGNNMANQIIGGAGDDILIGNGGADVLRGGAGDDVLAISDNMFAVINGGLGNDTLRLDSTMTLDLTSIPNNRLDSIEVINLNGTASTLVLATDDILSIVGNGAQNTLRIEGGSTDALDISQIPFFNSGDTETIGSTDYRIYRPTVSLGLDDSVALLIDPDVSVENEALTISGDGMFSVAEGGNYTLTTDDLSASDEDASDGAAQFAWRLSNAPTSGTLQVNGTTVSEFTQAQLVAGAVIYVHNGNEPVEENFTLQVQDDGTPPLIADRPITVTVTPVNDAPTISNTIPYQGLAVDGMITINLADFFSDPDGDSLSYTVASDNENIVTAMIADSTLTLTEAEDSALVNITVAARDEAGLEIAQTFTVQALVPAIELSDIQMGDNNGGFVLNGVNVGDLSGRSVSGAGDINGDGLDDIIIGADADGSGSGASYVVFGKSDGGIVELSMIADEDANENAGFVLNGANWGDLTGRSVSGAGDINGDGLDDIIIGAPLAAPNGRNSGASYVVFGKSDGGIVELSTIAYGDNNDGFVLNGVSEGDFSGWSVSGAAGDINGDGLEDIIISASGANSGASYVVFGKSDGGIVQLSTIADADENDNAGFVVNERDWRGYSVSGAGDVNGDGLDDIIIGALGADPNGSNSGASYVVFGKSDGGAVELSMIDDADANNNAGFVLNGVNAGDFSGVSVSGAGDINGDGLNDIIIGTDRAGPNGSNSGASYVVFGKSDGGTVELSMIADEDANENAGFVINGVNGFDRSGDSVSGAGDINGDGLDDIIIGAHSASPNGRNSGASYLVFGKSDGNAVELSLVEAFGVGGFVINGANLGDFSGDSVSGAGDVNGDGFDDLLIGASAADPNGNWSGASYVIFGGQEVSASAVVGDEMANTLTGDSMANQIIGGAGDDTLIGNGDADVLRGGAGDDVLAISDNMFAVINGGLGNDTLRFDAPISLDLSALRDPNVQSIETIDLANDGGNSTLSLGLSDVLAISGQTTLDNPLNISGATGDTVNLSGAPTNGIAGTWSDTDNDNTYSYISTADSAVLANVLFDDAIMVNIV